MFLSNYLCQDPLANFFGCQRQRGGTNNPTVQEFLYNAQSLRVVDGFCQGPIRGNFRQSVKENASSVIDESLEPLPKQRRKH